MKKFLSGLVAVWMVLLLVPQVMALEPCVQDNAGILTNGERQELEEMAQNMSGQYGCSVYVVTVPQYLTKNSSMQDFAESYYKDHQLGFGPEQNGIMLMLSMEERQYWLLGFGQVAFTAMTDYGQEAMEDVFLDDFGDDEWFDGFSDYLSQAEFYLRTAAEGMPYDVGYREPKDAADVAIAYGSGFGIAVLVAIIVGAVLVAQMKTAKQKISASAYIPSDGVDYADRTDRFTHVTTQRVKIQTNTGSSGSGGTTVHSSGFSGKGGSF